MRAIGGPFDGQDIGGDEFAKINDRLSMAILEPLEPTGVGPDDQGILDVKIPFKRANYQLSETDRGEPVWVYLGQE